jgi:hypothetical protein
MRIVVPPNQVSFILPLCLNGAADHPHTLMRDGLFDPALALLTTCTYDGIDANMQAELIHRAKSVFPDGSIVEMVIWRVPHPVPGSSHSYKYRLFYGRNGNRLVGFDNERGKGDHCHLDGAEQPYRFVDVERLVAGFLLEVLRRMPK